MGLRIVPFSDSYDAAEKYSKWADWLLYASTILSICITALSQIYEKELQTPLTLIIALNSVIIALLFYFDNLSNYTFTRAEMKRRLDFLDNAFDSKFSGKRSQEYFTNDHLPAGLYKLVVNCFENCHHSQFTIAKMLPAMIVKTIIIILAFVASVYVGNREIIRLFFELSLPIYLAQKLYKAVSFSMRMSNIYDRFKSLFNDLLKHDFTDKAPEALRLILDYETALAWSSTPLDSKVFEKNKVRLAHEWDELKLEYQIKNEG